MINLPHIIWMILILINFVDQILYFGNDVNNTYFIIKKVTTPLMLFGGFLLVLTGASAGSLSLLVILGFMGIGELGMEGSSIVEDTERTKNTTPFENLRTTIAGMIFLLVNIMLGVELMADSPLTTIIITMIVSILCYSSLASIFFIKFKPEKNIKFNIIGYSFSLIILFSGTLASITNGFSSLALAGIVLTISDSLVLLRMGAGLDKRNNRDYKILLTLLIIICILYYLFIAILINSANPFSSII